MKPLVQDILIGFVTTSDPGTDRGPANIITVAKAKLPQVIYLLYTDATQANRNALLEWLKADPELARLTVADWPKLDLPDVTDYEKLASLLPEEVKAISKQHPGAHFHLVSGLPQARIVFALCLHALSLTGTLWEVNPPEPPKPRPYQAPTPPQLDRKACEQRLKRWPTAIFDAFRNMLLERYRAVRLRLNLQTEQAWLDDKLLDLRASTRPRSEEMLISSIASNEKDLRPRTFQILVLLAAKKRYGLGNDQVPKSLIFKTAYHDQKEANAAVNIRRALDSINRQARRLTERSSRPLDPLILDVKRGGRPVGIYRLTDRLNPSDETIEFIGDVRVYLQKMRISPNELSALFPDLTTL
jgi:hypothetical protein